jgi:hypothetical protein
MKTIEITKTEKQFTLIKVDGKIWSNRKTAIALLGNSIMQSLKHYNSDGKNEIKIIVNGNDETTAFKNQLISKYSNVEKITDVVLKYQMTSLRDEEYKYANI